MAQLNRIILIGKITDEPDLKVSTDGKSIAKFTIETERSFGDKVDRISIVAWEKLADSVNEYSKGQIVLIEGRIQQRSYEDSEKNTVWVTEVVASSLRSFAGSSVSVAGGKEQDVTEDDIPF